MGATAAAAHGTRLRKLLVIHTTHTHLSESWAELKVGVAPRGVCPRVDRAESN